MDKLPFEFQLLDIKRQNTFKTSEYTLWLILNGTVMLTSDVAYDLRKNDVLFFMPGTQISVTPPYNGSILSLKLDTEAFCLNIGSSSPVINCNSAVLPGKYDDLIHCMMIFSEAYFNRADLDWAKLMSHYYMLIFFLKDFQLRSQENVPSKYAGSSQRMQALESYIRAHYKEKLSLNQLAAQFYLSPTYLSKYFTANFGINFHTYLQNIRLENTAKELLAGKSSISKAAYNNGFTSISSFNIAFKKKYGVQPAKFVKSAVAAPPVRSVNTNAAAEYQQLVSELHYAPQTEPMEPDQCIEYTADASTVPQSKLNRPWLDTINLGNASYLLNNDFQTQLVAAQKALHFKSGRIDGIIEMLLYSDSYTVSVERPNFSNFNRVVNFLLSIGLTPFFELGRRLSKRDATYDGYNLSTNKFFDIAADKWEMLIHNLLVHCVNLWGVNEVSTWRFEMWVQPSNLPIHSKLQNYVNYFEITQRAIKSIVPAAKFGGPGINLGGLLVLEDMECLLKLMSEHKLQPDFISNYLYPSCEIEMSHDGSQPRYNIKMLMNSNESTNLNKIRSLRHTIKKYYTDVPIYITEFTSDAIPRATINDTCFKSAFIVKTAIDLYDKVDCMGYWQLSDLTQEYQDANMILYGGNGLLSRHGIQKCGYFAYWFLGKLNMDILDCGKNHIVTAGTDNNYAVIVHNYKNLSNSYCTEYFKESKNYSYSELLDDTCPLHFKYLISGVHPGKYIIKKYTLNSRHGNLLGVVDELHCESYAGNEELEYLSRICVPQEQLSCVECTETLDLEATLEPLEVVLFTVSKHLD